MQKRRLEVRRPGRVAYDNGLTLQKELEQEVIERRETDYLLLLEHPHTYTIGRRANENGVLATAEMLKKLDATVHETNRGGKVTYHGIGQIVGYPIISLSPNRKDVHQYVRDLEEVLILTLGDFDIEGFRIKDLTGVHTKEGKVAAIGVHIKRWVTTHGFALNVNTDLSYFNHIVPCGIPDKAVTSMAAELGRAVPLNEVAGQVQRHLGELFDMELVTREESRILLA